MDPDTKPAHENGDMLQSKDHRDLLDIIDKLRSQGISRPAPDYCLWRPVFWQEFGPRSNLWHLIPYQRQPVHPVCDRTHPAPQSNYKYQSY